MQNRIDILNELKELSPVLAGMEKVNVFTVPAGYFETLAEVVLICVKQETGALINSIEDSTSMKVPTGYFDNLAANILNKIKAQETAAVELKELSPLLSSIPNRNVFTVPQGYFESLADNILNRSAIDDHTSELKELSPLLSGISNKNVFTVPQGYFESLTGSIVTNAIADDSAAAELRALSPMLYSVQNENVFTVPQGYFETLSLNILRKVEPQLAKVVTMKSSRRISSVLKYAVAAVFTGVIALGVYKYTAKPSIESATITKEVQDGIDIAKANKFDEEFAKVSDDDIIKYLQVNGTDIDAALVANTIDDKELPTQDEYLTDDKALDKYLDNIDLKDLKN